MDTILPSEVLEEVAKKFEEGAWEGYPPQEQRIMLGNIAMRAGRLIVPDGPWHITNHKNRQGAKPHLLDPEDADELMAMSQELTDYAYRNNLLVDQYGRAIHPYWRQLLADRRTALPTGMGYFWRYGANKTVDSIVHRYSSKTREFLLIKRRDNGKWALPGGFLDRSDESAAAGARRETGEETGLHEIGGSMESIVKRRPIGQMTTLHAWTENEAFLVHGEQDYLHDVEPVAGDDATDVGWFGELAIQNLTLLDNHLSYIQAASITLKHKG